MKIPKLIESHGDGIVDPDFLYSGSSRHLLNSNVDQVPWGMYEDQN